MRTLKKSREANSKYWKTPNGKLMLTYNNMKRRVDGYVKPHIYNGLAICERNDFYEWCKRNDDFISLYKDWIDSGCERKLSPSIDRIDSNKGYSIDNIQWITHSENSRKGALSRFGKL